MALTLNEMLAPQVILDVVSRIRIGQGRLGKWLGWHYETFTPGSGGLSGPNVTESPVRSATYRIFDATRTVAQGRVPGTGPGWAPPKNIGEVPFTVARFHEKMRLEAERLSNLAALFGPNSQVDTNGQNYVTEQETHLAQKFNNVVEIMAAGLIRGKFYLKQIGETFYPYITAPTAPYVTVDLQAYSGNSGQLNMLGDGAIIATSWDNPAAPIISNDLPKIMRAYNRLTGLQISDAWVDSLTWGQILTNTEVVNAAGSANTTFDRYERTQPGKEGRGEMVATLRGYPMIDWHIVDEAVGEGDTTDSQMIADPATKLTPVIPANQVIFTPPVETRWQELITYAEPISEGPMMPWVKRPGFFLWHEFITQPSAVEIIGLLNAIPALRIPKALVSPTVIF